MTLKLTENVLNTYVDWKAQVLHDLHESGSFLYDNTIGDGPYNAWLDPILTNEWQMIGWNNVNEMTRMGMPGVYAFGTFDTWSPGYLMFIAATHNGISRLYETFGNSGSADTLDRTLSPNETSRTWYRQNPPLPFVKWSLRNNNNYEQTGLIVSLNHIANNRLYFLRNFYEKSKRSILKAKTEGPAAYVLPATDGRLGRAGRAAADAAEAARRDLARDGGVHGAGAGAAPAAKRRPAAAAAARAGPEARRPAGGAGANAADRATAPAPPRAPRTEAARVPGRQLHHPHGSAVLAHRRCAARLSVLGAERSADQPVRRHRLDVPGRVRRAGGAGARSQGARRAGRARQDQRCGRRAASPARAAVFAINHNADNALITLRYKLQVRRHADRRGAVRGRRPEVRARIVHHPRRRGGRSRRGGQGGRPARARAVVARRR